MWRNKPKKSAPFQIQVIDVKTVNRPTAPTVNRKGIGMKYFEQFQQRLVHFWPTRAAALVADPQATTSSAVVRISPEKYINDCLIQTPSINAILAEPTSSAASVNRTNVVINTICSSEINA